MSELIIDKEFQFLKAFCAQTYLQDLETKIIKEGCLMPLITWNDVIIDGYKRKTICESHDIPFCVAERPFSSRNDAIAFICEKELRKNTINHTTRTYLLGRLVNAKYELSHENYRHNNPAVQYDDHGHVSQRIVSKLLIERELSLRFPYAPSTLHQFANHANYIDIIRQKAPWLGEAILREQVLVSFRSLVEMIHLSAEELSAIKQLDIADGVKRIIYSRRKHEMSWKNALVENDRIKNQDKPASPPLALIKQMPVPDPNSEFTSLTLTIPSWISTIKRTQHRTVISLTSKQARDELLMRLYDLSYQIHSITEFIREGNSHDE